MEILSIFNGNEKSSFQKSQELFLGTHEVPLVADWALQKGSGTMVLSNKVPQAIYEPSSINLEQMNLDLIWEEFRKLNKVVFCFFIFPVLYCVLTYPAI